MTIITVSTQHLAAQLGDGHPLDRVVRAEEDRGVGSRAHGGGAQARVDVPEAARRPEPLPDQ